jgi:hypothetical protein
MTQPSSRIRRLAALAAAVAVAACSTSPSKGLEESMRATVRDGMPVGDALHALQTQGFACASGLEVDRRIDCARNVANLTQTCVEHVSFTALSQQDAVSGFAVAEPACSRGFPEAAHNVPRGGDQIA